MEVKQVVQKAEELAVTKSDVIIRDVSVTDGKKLAEMEAQIFTDCWSEKSIFETIQNSSTYCFVAESRGKVIGYLLAYILADEVEITRIAVVEAYRRRGIGEQLLKMLRNNCLEKGYTKLLLDVREGNVVAQVFYQNIGFVIDGVRSSYYQNPTEDAVLMSCRID